MGNRLMQRHLAILEMENAHLRTLVSSAHHNFQMAPPHFRMANMQHFAVPNSCNSSTSTTCTGTMMNSMEPPPPPGGPAQSIKRRKLNNGSPLNTASCPSDNSSDIDVLEPLPLSNVTNANNSLPNAPPPPLPPVSFVPMPPQQNHAHLMPPNRASIHPSRLMQYPPPHPPSSHQYVPPPVPYPNI